MKKLMIAVLVAGQVLTAAQPAFAAELTSTEEQRVGAFGGLRVRVPLDGDLRRRPIRAGLALAPTLRTENLQGEARTRVGEGVELGFRSNGPASLSIAGVDLREARLRAAQDEDGDGDGGVPTWAIVGGAVLLGLGVGYLVLVEQLDCDDDEECS